MSKREIQHKETERRRLIRFADLKARGIVTNWPQVRRLIQTQSFPSGIWLGLNSRAWFEDEIEAWLESRPTDRKALQAEITA